MVVNFDPNGPTLPHRTRRPLSRREFDERYLLHVIGIGAGLLIASVLYAVHRYTGLSALPFVALGTAMHLAAARAMVTLDQYVRRA